MADLSKLVEYDKTFPVPLMFKGEPVGITFNIVSFDSERVVRAGESVAGKRWEAIFKNEDHKLTHEQILDFSEMEERERLISAIDSWDFGGNSFGDLGQDPECTEVNKRYIITHPNAKWITDQIKAKGKDLGNFSGVLPKPSKQK